MDTFSTSFQLEKVSPNEIFKAYDEGNQEGLKLLINDGVAETKFPIGDEDIPKLIRFLAYYLNEKGACVEE